MFEQPHFGPIAGSSVALNLGWREISYVGLENEA